MKLTNVFINLLTNLISKTQITKHWNDQSDLADGSYSISDIQDFFEFIFEKHEVLAENPPTQIYLNKIKNRIIFKIKTGYKLELLSPEQ